ncbi:MAG: TetR family transcriptional regulator [Acidimicrobiales bacterium]|nr:MAG: TetR family transcriptional regulator [Acidimicrobiales bacterium]
MSDPLTHGLGELERSAEVERGTESKGERTRRELLRIAVRLFGESGYRGTSVSEITRVAGLTQAAAYAYFPNKEALFREAVDTDAAELIEQALGATRAAGVSARHFIPTLLVNLAGLLEQHPLAARILRGLEPDVIRHLVDLPSIHLLGDTIAEVLRDGQRSGEIRRDIDPETIGGGVEALVLGLMMSVAKARGAVVQRHAFGVAAAFDAMIRPAGDGN